MEKGPRTMSGAVGCTIKGGRQVRGGRRRRSRRLRHTQRRAAQLLVWLLQFLPIAAMNGRMNGPLVRSFIRSSIERASSSIGEFVCPSALLVFHRNQPMQSRALEATIITGNLCPACFSPLADHGAASERASRRTLPIKRPAGGQARLPPPQLSGHLRGL